MLIFLARVSSNRRDVLVHAATFPSSEQSEPTSVNAPYFDRRAGARPTCGINVVLEKMNIENVMPGHHQETVAATNCRRAADGMASSLNRSRSLDAPDRFRHRLETISAHQPGAPFFQHFPYPVNRMLHQIEFLDYRRGLL